MVRLPVPDSAPHTRPDADALDHGLLTDVALGSARLTPEQALDLYNRAPLHTLGKFADMRCRTLHGDNLRTYIIDRNINYTNICTVRCTFCAFRRDATDHDAYTLEVDTILDKIAELVSIGGTQILMQGGMNPALPLEWYENLLSTIRDRFPTVHVHAFSPPEFIEFVEFFDPPGDTLEAKLRYVMIRLQAAGLKSIPGGGGEIFANPVRRKIGLGKADADAWLTCMYVAHSLGMFTSATMMFGHIEGIADRVHHMDLVRRWQDRALSEADASDHPWGHYKAFISWPFQPDNTPLGKVKEWATDPSDPAGAIFPGDEIANLSGDADPRAHKDFGRRLRLAGASAYLRTQALSRLVLDNIYSIGSSWVTMGPHIGQLGLFYGANDMGSVMMEENVVSAAGTTYCLDEAFLCHLVRGAGFVPAQRDSYYDILDVHATPDAPDLKVKDWSEHRLKKLHVEHKPDASQAPVQLTAGATD
jgi:cyclic dehypoxanthinyl futalosine synthase